MPEILPGAAGYWELWLAVQTQWRAAAFGLIGLDYAAVRMVAETMDMQWDDDTLHIMMTLENKELEAQAKDNGGKS